MGEPDERGGELWRGVLGIVLLGAALGIGQNAMQRAGGPRRGVEWIKQEVKLASLESLADAATTDSAAVDSSVATQSANPTPDSTTHAVAASDTSHKGRAPAKGSKAAAAAAAKLASKSTAAAAKQSGKAATTQPPTAATAKAATPPPTTPVASTNAAAAAPNVPDTREPLEAQYASIKKLYDAGVATFVDARSADEYAEGHIPGAVSMPFDDVFKNPDLAKKLETHGRPVVVTYCGGGDCDLSRNLAFSLIDLGHKKVLVFMGGMPGWKEAGNAVVTGMSAGTAP